ncbi:MAG: hypothetical protein AAFQ21_03330 [Pseudomonadota bacterium]
MAKPAVPAHLRTAEIKRRLTAMLKAAEGVGWEVGGIHMTPAGEITILDKTAASLDHRTKEVEKWLGD